MSNIPLVTALCLTKDRREWLPKAIDCFLLQTYPSKELLIVADNPSDVEGLIPEVVKDDCTISTVSLVRPAVVGEKRNIGCRIAKGEYIAVWDDDDFSAPGRIEQQVAHLEASRKSVTGYRAMKFTDGKSWWQYRGWPGFAMATSLFFRKDWWVTHPFPMMQCGQDELFGTAALLGCQMAECDDLDLMYATIHPGNTSPRQLKNPPYYPLPGFEWGKCAKQVVAA